MTLKTFVREIGVQGDVRLSVWNDQGEEVEVHEFPYVDNLAIDINQLPNAKQLYRMKVHFVFAPGDGFLHVELNNFKEV